MENVEVPNSVEVVATQNQILTLVDEVKSTPVTVAKACDDILSNTVVEVRQHSIVDFLKREIMLKTGTVDATKIRGDQITEVSLPGDYLTHAMIAPKIDGFRFIRGTFEIRIVHNAQPFQAGILRVFYFPLKSIEDKFNSALTSIIPMTGLNGVDVNFEDKESLLFEVPFIYPNNSFDMVIQPSDYAYVRLVVYSGVSSGSVGWTMFGRFKEVEISMPTDEMLRYTARYIQANTYLANRVMQQVNTSDSEEEVWERGALPSMRSSSFRNYFKYFNFIAILLSLWCWFKNKRYRGRVYNSKRWDVVQQIGAEEEATSGKWTLSFIMRAVGKIATMLSGVPLISSVANPISMISNGIADLASNFGYSSPRNEQIQTVIRPSLLYGMNNFNRSDISHQMALDGLNKLNISKCIFGTQIDEMSFKSIWYVPQYINSFKITTSTAKDTLLWWQKLNPVSMGISGASDTTTEYPITNLAFLSACFELWRGSLNFNFKVAKTSFHSARLAIVWRNIETFRGDEEKYNDRTLFNYQIIWDIRKTFEQTISIPYIQAIEWLNVNSVSNRMFKDHNGYICVYLINELQVGGNASNSIEILVESYAGHDYEVAIPSIPRAGDFYIRPTTSTSVENDMISVNRVDGFINGIKVPWYVHPETSIVEGSNYLAVPDSLRVDGAKINLVDVKLKSEVVSFETVDIANNKKAYKNSPDFSYDPNNKLKAVEVSKQQGFVYEWQTDGILTEPSLKRLKHLIHIRSVQEDIIEVCTKGKCYMLGVSQTPSHSNLITFSRPLQLHFRGYSPFFIQNLYILFHPISEGIYSIAGTNEHGLAKDVNVVFKAKLVTPVRAGRAVLQQVNYNEMLNMRGMENITGHPVYLPLISDVTIGESIQSIRQLCQRYTLTARRNSTFMADTSYIVSSDIITIAPFNFNTTYDIMDYPCYFSPMYKFYTGDIRYKVVLHRQGVPVDEICSVIMMLSGDDIKFTGNIRSTVLYHGRIEGVIEFTVPYYNRNNKSAIGATGGNDLLTPTPKVIYICRTGDVTNPFSAIIYRAIGDNFAFGCRLAAPTVYKKQIFGNV